MEGSSWASFVGSGAARGGNGDLAGELRGEGEAVRCDKSRVVDVGWRFAG